MWDASPSDWANKRPIWKIAINAAMTDVACPSLGWRSSVAADGAEYYEGGQILDPEEGKLYRLRLTPIEGGKKLQVRGYLGPFWRTQVWERP
jgi:hypothetical protein